MMIPSNDDGGSGDDYDDGANGLMECEDFSGK